ncbi:class III signal peptide-containing protein [Methanobacterium alcaliphilum]|uniref:class III signal peptide-containing protein n=1 Tax=Methanobacterium alcaliphilum TaxID=392018 RepID=UPI00200A65E3|nr:class III signal peptide-containing protein [Methanobacterium alcaliphilum]MCK9150339.1 class III signal peptide-containing protein [Methanobacterium alcaliphilum]
MNIFKDERAQGSAELVLLFGGMIVIVIIGALSYRNYVTNIGNEINSTDVQEMTNSIQNLKNDF